MYKAFISYSHAADGKLAPAIQSALERFAKPWYKVRYFSVFRDEASLSSNPHLWSNIQAALEKSEFMIYLASPTSASSKWVCKEIEYWIKHKPLDKLLIVLTEGEILWDDESKSFLNKDVNSLPDALENIFTEEPFYIDLRHVRIQEDLSMHNPIFKKEVLKLAAPLHGKEPKDLASEEVLVHRRMIRIRNAAISILVLLFIIACGAAWLANNKSNEAQRQTKLAIQQRDIAQGNYLISEAKSAVEQDPTLALRLAEEAMTKYNNPEYEKYATRIYKENNFYKILIRQEGDISSAAFSPDGKTILTTTAYDDTARLWDLSGKHLFKFTGHSDEIRAVAFSPDGKFTLTGSSDSTARLWNMAGNTVNILKHHSKIQSVAFSPDSKKIITGSEDSNLTLWDLDGNILRRFIAGRYSIRSITFSPDGETILVGSGSGILQLFNLKGNVIRKFKDDGDHMSDVWSVAFSPDGKKILTCSFDRTVRLWNFREGVILQKFAGIVATFSPDGRKILVDSDNNTARLWDISGTQLDTYRGASAPFAFSPDGKKIITGVRDSNYTVRTVRLWNLKGIAFQEFTGHAGYVKSVSFSPDGKKILSGSADSTARLWDIDRNTFQILKGHRGGVSAVAFAPDGKTVLTGSYDHNVRLWNIYGDSLQLFNGHQRFVNAIAFSPDGKKILTGSGDETARLWNLNGDTIKVFRGHSYGSVSTAFSPDGKLILTQDSDTARLWDLNGNVLKQFGTKNLSASITEANPVAFSPRGDAILVTTDNTFQLVSLTENTHITFGDVLDGLREIYSVVFSPDGQTILTSTEEQKVKLWNLNGALIMELKGLPSEVRSIAFSPDGKTILTGSEDHVVRMFVSTMPLSQFLLSDNIEPLSPEHKEKYGID